MLSKVLLDRYHYDPEGKKFEGGHASVFKGADFKNNYAHVAIKIVDLHPILPSLCMQEVPHPSVSQHNTVKQFDCCSRGNSECKYILFMVQISLQKHTKGEYLFY